MATRPRAPRPQLGHISWNTRRLYAAAGGRLMSNTQYPRLANLGDIDRLISGDGVFYEWPPPGTTTLPLAFPEPWVLVRGVPTEGVTGDWYVTTLSEMVAPFAEYSTQILAKVAALGLPQPIGLGVSLGDWPIIFEVGRNNFMRWIRTTLRGDLAGGVETFQHKTDLGIPGADPDISPAQAGALAEFLALAWQDEWAAGLGAMCGTDVRYLECGVTQCTQTDATAADGSGGNLEQDFETEWYAYGSGVRPTGLSGSLSLPYEVSCAVSLQTEKRGARGRGRMYLPPFVSGQMGGLGLYASAVGTAVHAQIGGYFDAIVAGTDYTPIVVSRRAIELHQITSVLVGKVPDSQRRRRRSQDEAKTVGWTSTLP